MKITKYLIALGGVGAILFWASSSSCTSKEVSCKSDSTFATASAVLVGNCSKCHGDSISAARFGNNVVFNGGDSTSIISLTYDPTVNNFYGIIVADLEATNGKHQMPYGGPNLSDCEIAAVKNWIYFHYTH